MCRDAIVPRLFSSWDSRLCLHAGAYGTGESLRPLVMQNMENSPGQNGWPVSPTVRRGCSCSRRDKGSPAISLQKICPTF